MYSATLQRGTAYRREGGKGRGEGKGGREGGKERGEGKGGREGGKGRGEGHCQTRDHMAHVQTHTH